jgi:glycogen debranching enzyme
MDQNAPEKIAIAPVDTTLDTSDKLIEEAAAKAREMLQTCIASYGLDASGHNGHYKQLWTRDSMITALGILATDDQGLLGAVRSSLLTLSEYQTERGLLPNKIDFEPKRVNFRAYADGGLLYVIVACLYVERVGDIELGKKLYMSLSKALEWYRYQDVDQSGLISTQEGSDWKDLFCQRGKTLYINALFHMALESLATLSNGIGQTEKAEKLAQEAVALKEKMQSRFWYEPGKSLAEIIQDSFSTSSYDENGYDRLGRKMLLPEKTILQDDSYFLPYITLRHFGEWFDTLGNMVAILSGVASADQAGSILNFMTKHGIAEPYPTRAVYPTQYPGDADWRDYYVFGDLNQPEHYHNGGMWPMVGGFYVAALFECGRKDDARQALVNLAEANRMGAESQWEFREYLHGKTFAPGGMRDQAWSAGSYLMAYGLLKK